MDPTTNSLWERFQKYFVSYADLDFALDISRMRFADDFLAQMTPQAERAFREMAELEKGAIANPDEQRMVGHYWLRDPQLAPNPELRADIEETNARIKKFAADVHRGAITSESQEKFEHLLLIGIGGSALGPQFIADALGSSNDPADIFFFDNTDPDGFDRVFDKIGDGLASHSCRRHLKIGRNEGNAQRHARSPGAFRESGSGLWQSMPSP